MKKNICASMVRKEINQGMLLGTTSLIIGGGLAYFTGVFSGQLLEILGGFAKNFVYIIVILFLVLGGGYLLIHGVCGLFKLESTDICRNIRTQLYPEEHFTGVEMITLVDKDLEYAREFANGMILIGQDWLLVPKAMGQSIIRLQNIQRIDCHGTSNTGFHLRFINQYGCGPVTGELTAVDVDAIKTILQNKVPNLEFYKD